MFKVPSQCQAVCMLPQYIGNWLLFIHYWLFFLFLFIFLTLSGALHADRSPPLSALLVIEFWSFFIGYFFYIRFLTLSGAR
jgi:hypothetical protein